MNLKDLKLKEKDRLALEEMQTSKTIAEVAVILGCSYHTAFTKLLVWEAQGWIRKIVQGRHSKYYLNQDLFEVDQ